ncbi:MAG TPA: hypothetical protein VFP97_12700 [Chitinophagaceae bacterium]|nr:hypothetical protein [Chitinophagaceae bacterium]
MNSSVYGVYFSLTAVAATFIKFGKGISRAAEETFINFEHYRGEVEANDGRRGLLRP